MKTSLALIALTLSLAITNAGEAAKSLVGTHQQTLAAQQVKSVAVSTNLPITITITIDQNVQVSVVPDGILDAAPKWVGSGVGQLFTSNDGMQGTIVSTGTGTFTLTITATSQGHPLSDTVVVTITNPQPPAATKLNVGVAAVPKSK